MKTAKLFTQLIGAVILFSSCASSYKTVNPPGIKYPDIDNNTFSYRYNVLKENNNKKLAKKEDKSNVRVIAIKIVNNTGHSLIYGSNYDLYAGNQKINVLSPSAITSSVSQNVPIYLLYLLLTPMRFTVTTPTSQSVTPIGYVVGPAVTGLNMAIAGSANKKFKAELNNYSIIDKEIKAGETFYGLIGIYGSTFVPITLKVQ